MNDFPFIGAAETWLTGLRMSSLLSCVFVSPSLSLCQVFDSLLNGDVVPYPSFYQNATGCTNYFNYMQCQVQRDPQTTGQPSLSIQKLGIWCHILCNSLNRNLRIRSIFLHSWLYRRFAVPSMSAISHSMMALRLRSICFRMSWSP